MEQHFFLIGMLSVGQEITFCGPNLSSNLKSPEELILLKKLELRKSLKPAVVICILYLCLWRPTRTPKRIYDFFLYSGSL